jgi:hypothetical protein
MQVVARASEYDPRLQSDDAGPDTDAIRAVVRKKLDTMAATANELG